MDVLQLKRLLANCGGLKRVDPDWIEKSYLDLNLINALWIPICMYAGQFHIALARYWTILQFYFKDIMFLGWPVSMSSMAKIKMSGV